MTHPLRIKICGITQPAQGRAIAQMGATSLGFICATRSPRYVTPEQIAQIVEQLPIDLATGKPIDRVGVFVDASIEEIRRVVAIARLNVVQLHGNESREFCQQLRAELPDVELVKALRIRNLEALQDARNYEDLVDALLLDAYDPTLYGGTGKTLDWDSLKQFRPRCSWILAGGLTPENVVEAVTQTHPDGIDLSSGVERSPGDKDLAKVAQLFEQLNFEQLNFQQWVVRRDVEAIAPAL